MTTTAATGRAFLLPHGTLTAGGRFRSLFQRGRLRRKPAIQSVHNPIKVSPAAADQPDFFLLSGNDQNGWNRNASLVERAFLNVIDRLTAKRKIVAEPPVDQPVAAHGNLPGQHFKFLRVILADAKLFALTPNLPSAAPVRNQPDRRNDQKQDKKDQSHHDPCQQSVFRRHRGHDQNQGNDQENGAQNPHRFQRAS